MRNLDAVLKASGSSLRHVVKTTVFLTSFADFSAMNDVYEEYLSEASPARSTVEVGDLPRNLLVQIECIATVSGPVRQSGLTQARRFEPQFDLDADRDF